MSNTTVISGALFFAHTADSVEVFNTLVRPDQQDVSGTIIRLANWLSGSNAGMYPAAVTGTLVTTFSGSFTGGTGSTSYALGIT